MDDRDFAAPPAAAPRATRRGLLAGGLAAAAAGLLLPPGAAAKKGNRPKGRGVPPGGHGPFRSAALTVENGWGRALRVDFFVAPKTGLDDYGPWVQADSRRVADGESARFDPDRYRVGAVVHRTEAFPYDLFFVDVRNVSLWFPRGGVTRGGTSGGWVDPPAGKIGSIFMPERDMGEDRGWGKRVEGKSWDWVILERLKDSPDAIEFRLKLALRG